MRILAQKWLHFGAVLRNYAPNHSPIFGPDHAHVATRVFMSFPNQATYVIIGAGIHGLSTAWRLAQRLSDAGKTVEGEIIVLEKSGIAAGASGIACGVVRNNYFQPAMRELMAHSVGVWESDPEVLSYHPVGYMQISSESMREDVGTIYEQQKAIGALSRRLRRIAARSRVSGSSSHPVLGRGISGICWACPSRLLSKGPTVSPMTISTCGATGSLKKACLISTPKP